MFSLANRKVLTTAALTAAVVGVASVSTLGATNSWTGGDGNYDTPASWSLGYPGGTAPQGSDIYPAGPWDDVRINNGATVTIDTDLNDIYGVDMGDESGVKRLNLRQFRINSGGEDSHTGYTAGSTLTVAPGGYLALAPTQSGTGTSMAIANGYDATINITGGQLVDTGSVTLGSGIGWAEGVQDQVGTGTLNVSGGRFGNSGSAFDSNNGTSITVGSGSNGVINLTGGTISTGQHGFVYMGSATPAAGFESYGTGIINQSGGTLENGRGFFIGSNAAGTYNLSGGTLISSTNNQGMRIGHNATGTLNVTGGTLQAGHYILIGSSTGDGLMAISDGTVTSSSYIRVGNSAGTGSGTLRITGTDASINITKGAGSPGALQSYANGTLNFQIDATGVSTVVTVGSNGDGRNIINLSGTLDLDLIGGFVPSEGQTFTLITTNNITPYYEDGHVGDAEFLLGRGMVTEAITYSANQVSSFTNTGLSLAAADIGKWTFDVVALDENAGHALVATYVPEPGSLALLGLAVPALLRRRRVR